MRYVTAQSDHPCVHLADSIPSMSVEESTAAFLEETRRTALAHFAASGDPRGVCRTVEHPVPPKPGDVGSTGTIVAHVSPRLQSAWEAIVRGPPQRRREHVDHQMHLALKDLADQDMHGYVAFTDAERETFSLDLQQLLTEALDRTSFSLLDRTPDPRWEGTLVKRVDPPYLILVASIDLQRG